MSEELVGMTFVITGAARGIGAETARLAASRGAAVVVSDVLDAGEDTAAAIRSDGGRARSSAATSPIPPLSTR
jgi:NAD(P)-dependent dehydrogenase (short-subunit alcohol dehydrogenase family)